MIGICHCFVSAMFHTILTTYMYSKASLQTPDSSPGGALGAPRAHRKDKNHRAPTLPYPHEVICSKEPQSVTRIPASPTNLIRNPQSASRMQVPKQTGPSATPRDHMPVQPSLAISRIGPEPYLQIKPTLDPNSLITHPTVHGTGHAPGAHVPGSKFWTTPTGESGQAERRMSGPPWARIMRICVYAVYV